MTTEFVAFLQLVAEGSAVEFVLGAGVAKSLGPLAV